MLLVGWVVIIFNGLGHLDGRLAKSYNGKEEIYVQKVAQEYADFIPVRPWFEFSFKNSLQGLWHETSLIGPHMIRKWERKIILSLEYSFKAFYAWLIELGSHSAYGVESAKTFSRIKNITDRFFKDFTDIQKAQYLGKNEYIAILPREQPFTDALIKTISTPVQFIDIAGNEEIVISVIAPKKWHLAFKDASQLFTMDILTKPDLQRIIAKVPVGYLMQFLRYLQNNKISIEHVYDY